MKHPGAARSATPATAGDELVLRLYVTVGTPASSRAIATARRLCEENLAPGHYRLDVFNLAEHIERAAADEVIASPTLVRASPLPMRRFIGDLSNSRSVASMLSSYSANDAPARERT
jgi:circadian clock protein KaiB